MSSTYERILETAYRMFALRGYEETSLQKIAAEVGISKPAVFHHFSSKEELFEVLYGIIVDRIGASTRFDFSDVEVKDFKTTLIDLGLEDILALKEDPFLGPALLQFYLLGLRNDRIAELNKRVGEYTRGKFQGIILRGRDIGCVPGDLSPAVLVRLCVMVSTSISEEMIKKPEGEYELLWETFVTRMFPLA